MNAALRELVLHANPWLGRPEVWLEASRDRVPEDFVVRAPPRARALEVGPERALLAAGPRQAGKSTWLWEAIRRRHDGALYLNGEERLIHWMAPDRSRRPPRAPSSATHAHGLL